MLPVDRVLPSILAALDAHGAVVVEGPPGSGKTTRVPPALLGEGEVWVLEPRRVAARAAASRVGASHAMRFDRKVGELDRLWYVTEALLERRLVSDPDLRGIDAVVLDEFHERSIHCDLALARIRTLRRRRPELRLVVMSATIDGDAVARWLGCPVVRAEGQVFPVEVGHLPPGATPDVAAAVRAGLREGDVLVFLPGVGEIERAAESLRGVDADVLPLHGEVDATGQDRALRPGPRRRVVLATNVAETSVTVEGVTVVIDTGLARVPGFDPWSGIATLELKPISRAAAAQRAGRAGRTAPGRCLRLYTRDDHDARAAYDEPEIRRVDLSGVVLGLAGDGVEWFEPPPAGAWRAAEELLDRLGAHGAIGAAMRRLPVAPRVARVLVEAVALGAGFEAASLAVLLGDRRAGGDLVEEALLGRGDPRERRQVLGWLGDPRRGGSPDALARALLAGFPDRVGKRRGGLVNLAAGGRAEVDSATPGGDGFVVVTGVERIGGRVKVRSMTPIPADWLVGEVREVHRWSGSRVEKVESLVYGELVIDEVVSRGEGEDAAAILRGQVDERAFPDHERARLLLRRVDWLRSVGVPVPDLTLDVLIHVSCVGRVSLGELSEVSLVEAAFSGPLAGWRENVDRLAPEAVPLGNRKRTPIEYPPGQAPFLASRMQDFFGLADGPRLGVHPLVLHLLAPSGRPVQVTTDLAGFWDRHYPALRRELMRRYPRHSWPEDPRAAEPPIPRRL